MMCLLTGVRPNMLIVLIVLFGCNKDDVNYEACDVVEDCADWIPEGATGVCLEKSGGGFCSWECAADDDCAAPEDDEHPYAYVCSSFESDPALYCFPSCEDEGDTDGEVCPEGFTCRSTGGGSDNRRICFPE